MTSTTHLLCASSALTDDQSLGVKHASGDLILVRKAGKVFAYRNRCPHLGVGLDWEPNRFLSSDNEFIQCAMHGALFLIDSGECISGPCVRESLEPVTIDETDGHIVLIDKG